VPKTSFVWTQLSQGHKSQTRNESHKSQSWILNYRPSGTDQASYRLCELILNIIKGEQRVGNPEQ